MSQKSPAWLGVSLLMVLIALASGCSADREVEYEALPVTVPISSGGGIDLDALVVSVGTAVRDILPGAYLSHLSLTASCHEVDLLRGQFQLDFLQVKRTLLGERVLMASAFVDPVQSTMDVRVRDRSDLYWDTEALVLTGLPAEQIATNLREHLSESGDSDCIVVLARHRTEGPWTVRCGPPHEALIECLEIDQSTGEIASPPSRDAS